MADGKDGLKLNGDIYESPLTEKEKIAWQTRRWKNRRRMAWSSVFALLAIILLFFFAPIPESRLAIIVEPISMMAFVFGGVIGAYMGFTTIEKMKLGK
jgi:hypothetical protein